jgi:hypothetical protein
MVLGVICSGFLSGCVTLDQSDPRTDSEDLAPTARPVQSTTPSEPGEITSDSPITSSTDEPSRSHTSTGSGTPETTPGAGPIRCKGDPISLNRVVEDKPGYDDNFRYFSDNMTVRYVASIGSDGQPARFNQEPVSEFAKFKGIEKANEEVRAVTMDRMGEGQFSGGGWGNGKIYVEVRSKKNEKPPTPLDRLVRTAPETAIVDVAIEDYEETFRFPVYAQHTEVIKPD